MLRSMIAMSRTSETSWVTEASLLTQTLCNLLTGTHSILQHKARGLKVDTIVRVIDGL